MPTEEIAKVTLACRSAAKMYLYLLCCVLRSSLQPQEAAPGVSSSQSSSQGGARPRKRTRLQPRGDDEDGSGLDVHARENAVRALVEVLSQEVAYIWKNETVEEPVLRLTLKTCLHMIAQPCNVEGDDNPVAEGLLMLLGSLSSRYCMTFNAAALLAEQSGAAVSSSVDPKGAIIQPLVELMMTSPQVSIFASKFARLCDREDHDGLWFPRFSAGLFESVAAAAMHEVSGDSQSAKALAMFIEEESRQHNTTIARHIDQVGPLIGSESYEIRKSAMTAIAELVTQRYGGRRTPEEELQRDRHLEDLLARFRDLNPYVRSHCIKLWKELFEAKTVPKGFFARAVQEGVGRLQDRHHLVRRAALQLIETCLRKSPFSAATVLSLSQFTQKKGDALKALLAKMGNDEAKAQEALAAARAPNATDAADAENINGDNAATEIGRQSMAPAAMYSADPVVSRVVFYEQAIEFTQLIHAALENAVDLLSSKTVFDVVGAIEFIVCAAEFRVDTSPSAVRSLVVMVFVHEPAVQDAACDAFATIFIHNFNKVNASVLARNVARAQKLSKFLVGSSEGEVSAIERILTRIRCSSPHLLSESLMDATWGIVDGSLDEAATSADKSAALRLYSLLATCQPKDVMTRKPALLEVIRANPTDNVLLRFAFVAMQKESLNKQYVPIEEHADINQHPVLTLLCHHLCRPTRSIGNWLPMADAIVTAIHSLHAAPVQVFTAVIAYIAQNLKADETASQQSSQIAHQDPTRLTQLIFLIGATALKQLISIDNYERAQLKKLDAAADGGTSARGGVSSVQNSPSKVDVMHKELGLGTIEYRRHEIAEQCSEARQRMLGDPHTVWSTYAPLVISTVSRRPAALNDPSDPLSCLRSVAILTLAKLMVVSESFCLENLRLLFGVLQMDDELWCNKTNIVIALGDIACAHPNIIQPYMKMPRNGFYALLNDRDVRVRAVMVQVCTHLVLNDMLRVHEQLDKIVCLVADPDPTIVHNATMFIQHLAIKCKDKIGNLIPPLVAALAHKLPPPQFEAALKPFFQHVEKDKPTESLIRKLCERFTKYSERDVKKQKLARGLAFCLSELSYTSERALKTIASETCYQRYRQWVRDDVVLKYLQQISMKAKRGAGPSASERRDRATAEEWEARLIHDAAAGVAPQEGPDDNSSTSSSSSEEADKGDRFRLIDESDEDEATKKSQPPNTTASPTTDAPTTPVVVDAPEVAPTDRDPPQQQHDDDLVEEMPPPESKAQPKPKPKAKGKKRNEQEVEDSEPESEVIEEPQPKSARPKPKAKAKAASAKVASARGRRSAPTEDETIEEPPPRSARGRAKPKPKAQSRKNPKRKKEEDSSSGGDEEAEASEQPPAASSSSSSSSSDNESAESSSSSSDSEAAKGKRGRGATKGTGRGRGRGRGRKSSS